MKNIGPKSREWLLAVGINNLSDLKKVGALKAYQAIKHKGFNSSLNLLWALEGAIQDRPWQSFSADEKGILVKKLTKEK